MLISLIAFIFRIVVLYVYKKSDIGIIGKMIWGILYYILFKSFGLVRFLNVNESLLLTKAAFT